MGTKELIVLLVGLVTLVIYINFFSSNDKGDIGDSSIKYEANWHEDFNTEISKTFVKNGIRGCGQYSYKARQTYISEYLVRCTADGVNYKYYLVWTSIQNVTRLYYMEK